MDQDKIKEVSERLLSGVMKAVEKQMETNDPPETEEAIMNLKKQGFSDKDIFKMFAELLLNHSVFLIEGEKFNAEKYKADLLKLPKLDKR